MGNDETIIQNINQYNQCSQYNQFLLLDECSRKLLRNISQSCASSANMCRWSMSGWGVSVNMLSNIQFDDFATSVNIDFVTEVVVFKFYCWFRTS